MSGPTIPVVIDTNVLVPALYIFKPVAEFLISGNLILVYNNQIYQEALDIIDRLADYYLTKADVHSYEAKYLLSIITDNGILVSDMPQNWPPASPDRKDDPFLFAALEGDAEYIISDDKAHMLILKKFRGIPIGKPREFFDWAEIHHPMII